MANMAQQQSHQQTSLNTLLTMMTEQGRKLDAFKQDWDEWREEMPDNYSPRRETDKAFADINRTLTDHEARLRLSETQIASAVLNAYKDTTGVREKALDAAQGIERRTEDRSFLDARSVQQYLIMALLCVLGCMLTYLLSRP